jgi:hypothetical protein
MQDQLMNFIFTRWVNPTALQGFAKNPGAPCCVDVDEGIAIKGKRRQNLHTRIFHKCMFNCGF